jgi:branched-chain amino acid transport system permease protein
MSAATQLYVSTLLVYFFVDLIAVWAFDLQFGVGGILNFAFIIFQAAGAYTVAILSLGPSSTSGGFQTYVGGWELPFPIPLLAAMAVGAILSLLVGVICLRRLRSDYLAMTLLVVSIIATTVVTAETGFLNGPAGLSLIPKPFSTSLGLGPVEYSWFFAGVCGVVAFLVALLTWRLVYSPFGRALRAMREDDVALGALGRDVHRLRLMAFVIGGAVAALSGALLAEFITAWAPGSWEYPETFAVLTAIIVGGRGNPLGVALGALLIMVGVQQAVSYLPTVINGDFTAALEWVVTGLVTLVFLWRRPEGLLRERRRRFGKRARAMATVLALPSEGEGGVPDAF